MAGHSVERVTIESGVLGELLADWQATWPQMGVFALLPEAEKERLPVLQAACRQRDIPLVGAIFPALVEAGGLSAQGAWLLRLDARVPTALLPDLAAAADPVATIADAVEPFLEGEVAEAERPTLFMVFDAMVGNISTLLDGLYLRLADGVRYAGVNAGSETFQPMPCLFDGERVVGGGVLCLLLPGRTGTLLEHGYPAPAHVLNATSTEGNRIISIDWRPAFTVYQEIVGREYGVDLTPENFYQYACHFPFGILRADGEVVVRIPVALAEDGSLFCVGEVPANTMLVLLSAPTAEASGCVDSLAGALLTAGMAANSPLLAFYCAGRRMHLGDGADRELAALAGRTAAAPLAGALSLGEIGCSKVWGYPMFHNATLVCRPWGGV